MSRPSGLLWVGLAAVFVLGVGSCEKRLPAAKPTVHPTGFTSVEALGRGVFDAVNAKTLFKVRRLFPTPKLYARYFKCGKNPISGMGRYHADGLHGVMRFKTEHGKVVVQTLQADQPVTKRKGERIGSCTFTRDVPHQLLTVTYTYPAVKTPTGMVTSKPKLTSKTGSWTFVTAQLEGRWYLFIILAMDGRPIDEIGLPSRKPPSPARR